MFTFTNFLLAVASLLTFSTAVDAASIAKRDVISPPILYPTNGTQWVVGETHNVTWDTSVLPPSFNGTGMILLGFLEEGSINEHLDIDHPLAKGFPLSAGRVNIVVPTVPDKNSYIVVLFGDSGNISGQFTIKNLGITSNPSTSATSPSSTGSTGIAFPATTASATATPSTRTEGGSVFSTPEASAPSSAATSGTPAVTSGTPAATSGTGTAATNSNPGSSAATTLLFSSSSGANSTNTAPATKQSTTTVQNTNAALTSSLNVNTVGLMGFVALLSAFTVL